MDTVVGDDLLATVRADREAFDRVLAAVPADRLEEPVLDGGWSVRDVVGHIAWGEREAIGMARAKALVGSPLWELPQDERNARVVEESRVGSREDVLRDYRETFDRFVEALAALSDDELNDPTRYPGLVERIPGWRPWRVLYDPDHYAEHGKAIAAAFGISPGRGS